MARRRQIRPPRAVCWEPQRTLLPSPVIWSPRTRPPPSFLASPGVAQVATQFLLCSLEWGFRGCRGAPPRTARRRLEPLRRRARARQSKVAARYLAGSRARAPSMPPRRPVVQVAHPCRAPSALAAAAQAWQEIMTGGRREAKSSAPRRPEGGGCERMGTWGEEGGSLKIRPLSH